MILKDILKATGQVKREQAEQFFINAGITDNIASNNNSQPLGFDHYLKEFRDMDYFNMSASEAKSFYIRGSNKKV